MPLNSRIFRLALLVLMFGLKSGLNVTFLQSVFDQARLLWHSGS